MSNTATEILRRRQDVQARVDKLTRRIEAMNEKLVTRHRQISEGLSREFLKTKFNNSEDIFEYTWQEERIVKPRRSFISEDILYPFTVVMRGTLKDNYTEDDTIFSFKYPKTIWLAPTEFTYYKLKGQFK